MLKIFNTVSNKRVNQHGFDLVLIIDRSGSMEGTRHFILESYQYLLDGLRKASKNITLTTVLFDDLVTIICDGKRLNEVKKLDYQIGGFTALYDALGTAIIHENKRKKNKDNPFPDADVLYLTVTDGEENNSRIFDLPKINDLMEQERRRSIQGHGVREFATITEFGIDYQKMEKELKLGKNKSQVFYRGYEGIAVLFKIIELAAENMLEYRRITDKWIKKSDQLMIGDYTLAQVKEMTKKPQRVLANLEKVYMELLLEADNGLTEKFWALYHKFGNLVNKLERSDCMNTGDETIDYILSFYIKKNETNLKDALNRAKDAMIDKVAVRCGTHLGKVREVAEDKKAGAKELFTAVNLYNESIKKLDHLPMYFQQLKTARLADRISNLIYEHERRFKTIMEIAFKTRLALLLDAYGTNNHNLFQSLSEFTQEPHFTLYKSHPAYTKYCSWYESLENERQAEIAKQNAKLCLAS